MATLGGGVLAVQHKAQQSQDSGADLDWSSEDSGGSPVLLRQMEDVEESFVTVVQVGGGNAEVSSPGVEKPDLEATAESFVTVLSIGDEEKGVNLNVGCDSGVIEEDVLVYRLPGERLGFGLKFEGGAQSTEKVRRLFIQSCAPDSPASRARASWGPLQEGDEVLAIDSAPVDRMTRIDCVRCLKESHVVIQLQVRHVSSPPPQVVGAEVKKMLPPPPSMPPPPIPPRKGSRKNHQAIVGPPTAFADTNTTVPVPERPQHVNGDLSELWNKDEEGAPPEAEVYLDVVSQEAAWAGESESDDTGSSISTVVDRLSTANSSFSASTCPSTPTANAAANSIDLQRVLDPFEQLEREFQTDSDFLLARTLADTPAASASMSIMSAVDDPSVAVPLQPPLSFQDAPLSYGDEKFVSSIKKSEKDSNEDDDLSVDNHIEETLPSSAPIVPALPPKPAPRREVPTSKFRSGKKRPPPPPPPPIRAERPQPAKPSADNIQTIPVSKPETAVLPRLVDVVPKERDDRSLGALPDVIGHVTERDKTDEIWDEVDRLIQDVDNSNKKQTLHISEKVETLKETNLLSMKPDEILQSVNKELNLTLQADPGSLDISSVSSSWETIPLNDEPTFTIEAEIRDITSKNATPKSDVDKKIQVNTAPSKYENIEIFFNKDSSKVSPVSVTSTTEMVICAEQEKQPNINNDFIVKDGSPVKTSTEPGYENNKVSKDSQIRANSTATLGTSTNGDAPAEVNLMNLDSPKKNDSSNSTVEEDALISFDSPVKVLPPVEIQHIPPESPTKNASLIQIDSPIKTNVFTAVDSSIISYSATETSSLVKIDTEKDSPCKAEVSIVDKSVVNIDSPVEAISLPSSPVKTDSAPTKFDSDSISCDVPSERESPMKESLIEESVGVNNDSQVNPSSSPCPNAVSEECGIKESILVSPKQSSELKKEEDVKGKPVLNTEDSFHDDEMLLKITSTEIENNTSIDVCLESATANAVTKQENVTDESSHVASKPADEKDALYCKPGKEDVLFKMDSTIVRSDSLPLKLSPVHVTEELLLLKVDSPIAVGKTKVSLNVDEVIESSVDDEFSVEELKEECVTKELSEESDDKQDTSYLKEGLTEMTSVSPCDDDRFFDVGQSPELIEKEESVDPPEYVLEGNDSDTDSDEFHLALGDLENGSSVFQPAATDAGFFPFRCWGAACHLATIGEDEEEAESSVPPVPGVSVEDEEEKEEMEEEEEGAEEGEEVEEKEQEPEKASEKILEEEHEEKLENRKEEDADERKEEVKEAEIEREDKPEEEEEEELVEAAVDDDDDEEEDQVDANPAPSPASRLDEIVMNAIPEPSSEICEDALELPTKQIPDPEPPISVVQPHELANGGAEDVHQLCRAAEVTAEKSDSDIGTMEDALQALDSLTSSCSSRLPPDGHEFPPNYQEVAPQEIMMPPPPLPVSGPPAKLEEPTRSPWRSSKDERSECSVKDKIAMFSQQQSANSSPTRRRFNSTEDVFRDSSSVLSFKSQDSLYKSQETLYPSKTQDYLYSNGKPLDTSYKVEEPLYTSTRVQDPLYVPKTQEPYSPKIQEPTLSAKSVNSFYSSTKTVETQLPNKPSDTLYSSNKTDSIYSNTNGQESIYSTSKPEPLYAASKVPESVFSSTKIQETYPSTKIQEPLYPSKTVQDSYPSTKIQEPLYPSKTVQDTYFASSRPLYSGNKGLYKSQEALYPGSKVQESFFSKSADSGCTSSASSSCSSSAYSSCSPESSLTYSTLPRKLQSKPAATPTLSRATSFSGTLHSRSQSLIDIGPAATGHLKTEEMRRASLNALIEQRRRGYSKLRGLVIPEKVSEASHAIPDLPEIRSVITVAPTATRVTSSSTSTTTSSTTNRWSNNIGQLPATIPSPPWKNQAQNNVSNLPKYSPAFKRKSLSVYTSSKPTGLNLKPSTTPPLRSPCEDESDGDSAVSVSPPPGRVLKAQSVEAINRKNVLSSARHSSGCDLKVGSPLITRKFDEPLHRSDEDDADEEDEDGEEPPTRIAYMEEVVEEDDLPPPPIPVAPIPEKPKPLPAPRRTSIPTPKRQSAPLPPPKPAVSPPSPSDDLLSLLTGGSQLRRQRSRENCETSRIPTSTTVRSNNEISRVPALAVAHDRIDSPRIPSPPSTQESLEQSRLPSPPSEKKEAPLFSNSIKKLETTPSPVLLVSKEKPDTSVSPPLNTHESTYSPSTLSAQENVETSIPLRTRDKLEPSRISSLSAPRDNPEVLQNPPLPASDPPRISTTHNNRRSVSVHDIRKAFEKAEQALSNTGRSATSGSLHARVSSLDSTTSEDCNFRGIGDQFGSVTSIASSTSLISPQDLQVLIDEANQPLEDSAVPVPVQDVQVVVLHREGTTGSVGIILAGGADYEAKEITVHKVLSGSPADRDGRIQKGDRILSINGRSMKGVTHRESLNILKAPRSEVVLVVSQSRAASGDHDDDTPVTTTRSLRHPRIPEQEFTNGPTEVEPSEGRGPPTVISLIKDGAGLGFSLEGGKDSPQGDRPLTIKKIFTGGSAEKNGQLKAGDELLNVNGTDVTVLSRIEAWGLMKRLPDGPVSLTVRHKLATV